jgi:hypothetical protein
LEKERGRKKRRGWVLMNSAKIHLNFEMCKVLIQRWWW